MECLIGCARRPGSRKGPVAGPCGDRRSIGSPLSHPAPDIDFLPELELRGRDDQPVVRHSRKRNDQGELLPAGCGRAAWVPRMGGVWGGGPWRRPLLQHAQVLSVAPLLAPAAAAQARRALPICSHLLPAPHRGAAPPIFKGAQRGADSPRLVLLTASSWGAASAGKLSRGRRRRKRPSPGCCAPRRR